MVNIAVVNWYSETCFKSGSLKNGRGKLLRPQFRHENPRLIWQRDSFTNGNTPPRNKLLSPLFFQLDSAWISELMIDIYLLVCVPFDNISDSNKRLLSLSSAWEETFRHGEPRMERVELEPAPCTVPRHPARAARTSSLIPSHWCCSAYQSSLRNRRTVLPSVDEDRLHSARWTPAETPEWIFINSNSQTLCALISCKTQTCCHDRLLRAFVWTTPKTDFTGRRPDGKAETPNTESRRPASCPYLQQSYIHLGTGRVGAFGELKRLFTSAPW